MNPKTNPMDQKQTAVTDRSQERQESHLLRADMMPHGDSLPHRIGRQLRSAYPAPDTREDAFQSLLQKIETLLP